MAKTAPRAARKPAVAKPPKVSDRVERRPIERIHGIRARIADAETVTSASLATEFGVKSLTIKRDIAMMRDPMDTQARADRGHLRSAGGFRREEAPARRARSLRRGPGP
jgi:hypothetical protein